MTFVKLNDRVPEDVAWDEATNADFGLYVRCITYCGRNETDGFVPTGAMRKMGSGRAVGRLVDLAFLTAADGGWWVAGYLDEHGNRSKAEIDRTRDRWKRKKQRQRSSPEESPEDTRMVSPGDSDECPPGSPPTRVQSAESRVQSAEGFALSSETQRREDTSLSASETASGPGSISYLRGGSS